MKRERVQQLVTLASASLFGISLIFLGIPRVNSKEPEKPAPKEPITYAKDVSRIIQDRCQTCHHAGTAAPFSLLTYKDAVRWAERAVELIDEAGKPDYRARLELYRAGKPCREG